MSKVTECSICLERYNINNKMPKILHCGHTFCKECLYRTKQKSNNILECPICRKKELFEDIEELSTNRVIFDLLYNPNQEEDITIDEKNKYKIIIIGSASTGKTSLLNRYIKKEFINEYKVTIGADVKTHKVKVGDEYIGLNIWDTAGTEKFQSIQRIYYLKSYAALIVFDVCCRKTFESLSKWILIYKENKSKELKELIYLIGNKIDIKDKREVTKEEAEEFAKLNNLKYYETSAKDGTNVDKIFNDIGHDLVRIYKEDNIFIINDGENEIKKLEAKNHLENKTCWESFIESIKRVIFFWKE